MKMKEFMEIQQKKMIFKKMVKKYGEKFINMLYNKFIKLTKSSNTLNMSLGPGCNQ